jgi:hypothetical protein
MSDENYTDPNDTTAISTPGGAVTPYMPDDGGWNAPPDESGRQIAGELLRFDNGKWYIGKEKTPVADGTRFLAMAIQVGWKCWEGGKVVKFVSEIDGRYPRREQLGHLDETRWPKGLDGKPSDPWQNSREALLVNPRTFEQFTFCIASKGGRSALDDLKASVATARRISPGVVPVVELASKMMSTQFGMKPKPYLKIIGWRFPQEGTGLLGVATPKGGNGDLDDEIPF